MRLDEEGSKFAGMPPTWDLRRPLRLRSETGQPPDEATIKALLEEHWGAEDAVLADARQGGAVHPRHRFVRLGEIDAFYRVDPGWEGPHPPAHTVRLLDSLGKAGAPVPRLLPLSDGRLALEWRDFTISLETRITGTSVDSSRLDVLPAAGESLARVHQASAEFDGEPAQRTVGDYVLPMLDLAANREGLEPRDPFRELADRIVSEQAEVLALQVPWSYGHGDVGCGNIIEAPDGGVSYIDFGRAAHLPSLVDVIMPRFQWLMGDPTCDRGFLSESESASFVTGYERSRPLSRHERSAIPVVWAAYYAEYLSFLWVKWGASRDQPPKGKRFGISQRITHLSGTALEMGTELVREL